MVLARRQLTYIAPLRGSAPTTLRARARARESADQTSEDSLLSRPPHSSSVVIAHDYLTQRGGGERVVLALLEAFPGARVVTSIFDPDSTFPEFGSVPVQPLRHWPLPRRPSLLRLAQLAAGQSFAGFTVTDADLVVCSSSGWAHGIQTEAPKLVYCHSPARWLYEPADYFPGWPRGLRAVLYQSLAAARKRDRSAARSASAYAANSTIVQDRVRRFYGIRAEIIHPPPGVDPSGPVCRPAGVSGPGFLLVVSRKRAYKNTDAVLRAVEGLPDEQLVIVGGTTAGLDVNDSARIIRLAGVTDAELRWLYMNCSAVIAVAHEDFGLTPVEGYCFGKPVIALRSGGYLDTVVDGGTGVFVNDATPHAVRMGIRRVREGSFDPAAIKAHSQHFSKARFIDRVRRLADELTEP